MEIKGEKMEETSLEHRLTAVEKKVEFNAHEIDELKPIIKEINTMSKTMVKLVEQSKQTNDNVKELKVKVDKIEAEPADDFKHYRRTIISCILTTIIGGLIGAIIALVI